MQTEFEFTLPRGYLDANGNLHRTGRMRLATALDEIQAMQDPRVDDNEAYLPVVLLSRVITGLGTLPMITPAVIEGLFASDFSYLEDLYTRLNVSEPVFLGVVCPVCNSQFQVQAAPLEESERDQENTYA